MVPASALVFVALAVAPALAAAESGLTLQVFNHTQEPHADVTLVVAGSEECWNNGNLVGLGDTAGYRWITPGKETSFSSSRSYALFRGCSNSIFGRTEGFRQLAILVRDRSGGHAYMPEGEGLFKVVARPLTLRGTGGFRFEHLVDTWVPRKDGLGLICWRTSIDSQGSGDSTEGFGSITIYNGHTCNSAASPPRRPVSARAASGRPAAATVKAPESRGPGSSGSVINLLSTVGVACPWWAYPGDVGTCARIDPGGESKWSIANLTRDVRNFKFTGAVGAVDPYVPVGRGQLAVPASASPGTVTVAEAVATSQTSTTQTQVGGKVGTSFGFEQSGKFKLPGLAEGGLKFSQSLTFEANWSKSDANAKADSTTRTVTISVGAKPGFTTRLDVFTNSREANYEYAADLDFGKPSAVEPVVTPANQALGQSPAHRQPCLGYVVGDRNVYGSIMQIGDGLLAAGFSPTEPSLTPERRAFLQSIPSFSTQSGDCPGFPSGFAAAAGFKGVGVGTYRSTGYDAAGVQAKTFTGCVYVTPVGGRTAAARRRHAPEAPSAPPSDTAPCQDVSPDGGTVTVGRDGALNPAVGRAARQRGTPAQRRVNPAGALLDFRRDAVAGRAIVAPPGSDEIFAPEAGGTLYTNNGALDIVHVGRGSTTVIGGSGDNVIYGGNGGRDVLQGGHGGRNFLIAGAARTVLRESSGAANMYGGRGVNTFRGANMQGVMLGGSGPNTMIATGDTSGVAMTGGSGRNVYEVLGRGTPDIIQLPRSASRSELISKHSMRVPRYVERAVAIGNQHVTLVGSAGTKSLKANNAGDVLRAGPGAETLRGGRGRDRIVFSNENDDTAIGGAGPDQYRFSGRPANNPRPSALQHIANRTASTIVDFHPRSGDRLVLSARVFGAEVLRLGRAFDLVAGLNPRPRTHRPTLLFNTHTRILSFDRDGAGRISDQVIVRLRGAVGAPRRGWFEFVSR